MRRWKDDFGWLPLKLWRRAPIFQREMVHWGGKGIRRNPGCTCQAGFKAFWFVAQGVCYLFLEDGYQLIKGCTAIQSQLVKKLFLIYSQNEAKLLFVCKFLIIYQSNASAGIFPSCLAVPKACTARSRLQFCPSKHLKIGNELMRCETWLLEFTSIRTHILDQCTFMPVCSARLKMEVDFWKQSRIMGAWKPYTTLTILHPLAPVWRLWWSRSR